MERKSTRAVFLIYCATLIITVLTVIISVMDKENLQAINGKDYKDFSSVWHEEDGSRANLTSISGEYSICAVLPEVQDGDVIYFNTKSLNVDVFLEEECIYQTHVFNPVFFGLTAGSDFVSIPLEAEYSGRQITMKLNNPYYDGSGKITQIRLGNEKDMVLSNVNSRIMGF